MLAESNQPPPQAVSETLVKVQLGDKAPAPPRFYALLFEVKAAPGVYVMQLVPRDMTEPGVKLDDSDEMSSDDETFFAPPEDGYAYRIAHAPNAEWRLLGSAGVLRVTDGDLPPPNLEALVAKSAGASQKLKLRDLLQGSYPRQEVLYSAATKTSSPPDLSNLTPFRHLNNDKINRIEIALATSELAKAALVDAAAAAAAKLSLRRSLLRAVEERRSSLIAAIASSAQRLADEAHLQGGTSLDNLVWPARRDADESGVIDARDLGLTFVVRESADGRTDDTLSGLFAAAAGRPLRSNFTLTLRKDQENIGEERHVLLFNPPSFFFDRANPILAGLSFEQDRRGIALDWDLRPGWSEGDGSGAWGDPEFHLKCYRIARVFLHNGLILSGVKPFEMTSKAAAPLHPIADGDKVVWAPVRPLTQFVDDFTDLPDELRPALLGRALNGGDDDEAVTKSRQRWSDRLTVGLSDAIQIEYTIVPVDIAGHEGAGSELRVEIPVYKSPNKGLARAELIVAFDILPRAQRSGDGSIAPANATLALRVDDIDNREAEDKDQPERLPPNEIVYEIRVRPEPPVPIGLFGADAMTAALGKPTPDAFEIEHEDDETFYLTMRYHAAPGDEARYRREKAFVAVSILDAPPPPDAPYFAISADQPKRLAELLAALGFVGDGSGVAARPVRVAVRDHNAKLAKGDPRRRWLIAETYLRVGDMKADRLGRMQPRPIDTIVETFETPVAAGFAPLSFEDLYGESGRLLIDYPQPGVDFADFAAGLSNNAAKDQRRRLRDGDRRVATRVQWNSRPTEPPPAVAPGVVNASPNFIAGFDVFEIDLTGALTRQDIVDTARDVARVMTLDPRLANAEPSTIEDYGAIEAFYQSEALRLIKAEGAARRAAWYSPAESLCVWPDFRLRKSLGLAINDADFSPLFALGPPDRIEIAFDGAPTVDAQGAFDKDQGAGTWARLFKLASDLKKDAPQLIRVIALKADRDVSPVPASVADGVAYDGELKVKELRRLLFGLVTAGDADDWWNAAASQTQSAGLFARRMELRGLDVKVVAMRKVAGDKPRKLGEATFRVDLDQFLHPVLADALDALRWKRDEDFYRRYQPVVDPAPHTDAKSFAEFLDQRPIGRDPYGWATLRTLGLAIGVRLFDMVTNDFAPPDLAPPFIHKAFATALARYPDVSLGAPTVETLARAEGLYTLASFDGGSPATSASDSFQSELASLTQLSLRPIAEDLTPAGAVAACFYFRVEASSDAMTISVNVRDGAGNRIVAEPLLIDLIDISSGLSAGLVNAIAANDDKPAIERLAAGRRTQETFTRELQKNSLPRKVLLLRIMTTRKAQDFDALLKKIVTTNAGALTLALASTPNARIDGGSAPDAAEPFERFPELPPTAIAALIAGVFPPAATGGAPGRVEIEPQAAASDNFQRLRFYADARFPAQPLAFDSNDRTETFFGRWPGLVRRFLANGPTKPPGATNVGYAFALIPRPQPFRARIENDGTMQILLVHSDRLARRRRYMVRPFSRYDNLMAAWDAGKSWDAMRKETETRLGWMGARRLSDSVAPPYAQTAMTLPLIALDDLDRYSVDVVAPRTEPLPPPVALSARRLDLGEGTAQRPGKLIEFAFARHQDEIASEFNATVADSLQFEHVAFGFWREFAHKPWGDALKTAAKRSDAGFDVELLPAARDIVYEPDDLSFGKPDSFDELAEGAQTRASLPARIVDGWRGLTVLRTQGVPHFQRVHVAAFAAAGVVVSAPVVSTIAEGRYELNLPDAPPSWGVGLENGVLQITARLPLSRFVDGMSRDERENWYPTDPLPRRAFNLPDPGVVYELSTRYQSPNGGAGDSVAEAAYAVRDETEASYAVVSTSKRLHIAASAATPEWSGDAEPWRLAQSFTGLAEAPTAPPSWADLLGGALKEAGAFDLDALQWQAFSPFAPKAATTLTLSGPFPDDAGGEPAWNALATAAAAYRAQIARYAANGPPAPPFDGWPLLDALLADVATIANDLIGQKRVHWNNIAAAQGLSSAQPLSIPVVIRAGVPLDAGTPVKVQLPANDAWKLDAPGDASYRRRAVAMAALAGATPRPTSDPVAIARFADGLAGALWSQDRAATVVADAAPTSGFAPIARSLPAGLDARGAAAGTPTPGLEFVARFDIDAPPGALWPPSLGFEPFAQLLDYLAGHLLYPGQPGLGFAAALESLKPLELKGDGAAALFVPMASISDVATLLAAIPGVTVSPRPAWPAALVLRRPPTDAELHGLADPAVANFAYELAADQIFGVGRRPFWKANKGLLDARSASIQREGEALA